MVSSYFVVVVAVVVVVIAVVKRKLKFDRNFRIKTGAKAERDYNLCEKRFCGRKRSRTKGFHEKFVNLKSAITNSK